MKWLIVAGGTAGHINPAIALAKIAKKNNPHLEIIFCGSKDRLEAQIIPSSGFRYLALNIISPAGNIWHKIKSLISLIKAFYLSKKILKKEKVDICIGFGNYISVPILLAAHYLHIPIMLHEQNSYPGKANIFLSKYAKAIVTCFEENIFPKEKTRRYGNPQTSLLQNYHVDKKAAFKLFDLDINLPLVVIMLGSLGSYSVSSIIDQAIDKLADNYQVLISSGKSNTYKYQHVSSKRVKIVPYFDGKTYLSLASLAITRAGATTIAELQALRVPCFLIPSPYVANNHQVKNALSLAHEGCAIVLDEKHLTADLLADKINKYMQENKLLLEMKERANKIQNVDTVKLMIKWIEEIVHES